MSSPSKKSKDNNHSPRRQIERTVFLFSKSNFHNSRLSFFDNYTSFVFLFLQLSFLRAFAVGF